MSPKSKRISLFMCILGSGNRSRRKQREVRSEGKSHGDHVHLLDGEERYEDQEACRSVPSTTLDRTIQPTTSGSVDLSPESRAYVKSIMSNISTTKDTRERSRNDAKISSHKHRVDEFLASFPSDNDEDSSVLMKSMSAWSECISPTNMDIDSSTLHSTPLSSSEDDEEEDAVESIEFFSNLDQEFTMETDESLFPERILQSMPISKNNIGISKSDDSLFVTPNISSASEYLKSMLKTASVDDTDSTTSNNGGFMSALEYLQSMQSFEEADDSFDYTYDKIRSVQTL